jgi:uncharacterized protein YndB with AHSA1/START domain
MASIEFHILISAPAEEVFARVSDLQNHIEWSGGEAIRKTSEGAVAAGTTYETEEALPLGKKTVERSVVTDVQLNERFGWRTYGPIGTWLDWSFELQPEDGRTRLTQRLEPKRGLLTAIAMKLFIERQMRKSMPESLSKLREVCERDRAG